MQFTISPLSKRNDDFIRQKIDAKTKPPSSLGQLETLAFQLAKILGHENITIKQPTMVLFAGDHGIAEEDISIVPPQVTQLMVQNMLGGGAAINCFCNANNIELKLVDAGVLTTIEHKDLLSQPLGQGTKNFSKERAMPLEKVSQGLRLGGSVSKQLAEQGCNVIGFGEMGIANTSSAAAVIAAITGFTAEDCVGRGTGISDEQFNKKSQLIESALSLHHSSFLNTQTQNIDPLEVLSCVGGFEIVQMTGAMLSAAENGMVILIDGFIATACALAAQAIEPTAKDYMVFCHQSQEQAHKKVLDFLGVEALLDLQLRLGEGTGAALAMPLLHSAAHFYNHMASFESLGIEGV